MPAPFEPRARGGSLPLLSTVAFLDFFAAIATYSRFFLPSNYIRRRTEPVIIIRPCAGGRISTRRRWRRRRGRAWARRRGACWGCRWGGGGWGPRREGECR